MHSNNNPGPSEVSKLAFKAPPLWKNDVELWFIRIEASFKTSGISLEETKFYNVIASLDADTLVCVRDIVSSPPTENPYTILKARIIKQYTQTESSRLRTLLQDLQLGDRKPSQLLLEMQNLADKKISDEVLKEIWLQRLTVNLQQILSISKDGLSELSVIADRIYDISVSSDISTVSQENHIQSLQAQISELSSKLDKLTVQARGSFRSRRRSRSSSTSKEKKPFCWYHFKFAEKAKKCVKPCSFNLN